MDRKIPAFRSLARIWPGIGKSRAQYSAVAALLVLMAFCESAALAEEYQRGAYRHFAEPEKATGDISSAQICPKGEYMVGFTGRRGAWIDRIGIRCAPLLPSGVLGKPHGTPGSGMGGGGGEVFPSGGPGGDCTVYPIIQIIFYTTNEYRMIWKVVAACGPEDHPASAERPSIYASGTKDLGDPYFHHCPPGMAATGLSVRFGKDVNAIGLICDPLKLPGVGSCPSGQILLKGICQAPPLLPGTTTGAGGGFIKLIPTCPAGQTYSQGENRCVVADVGGAAGGGKTGFAKPTPNTGEPAATAASFSGRWAASADNVRYTIILSQNGNGVFGNYQGTDGSVGTINGKLNGNVLRFAWVQRDGNKGTGRFLLSNDGQSFDGSYNFGNNPDAVEGRWSGTRQ
jgi:hypothetical protein